MPEFTLPDGTVIEGIPEGTTPEQIMARVKASNLFQSMPKPFADYSTPNHPTMSDVGAFGRGAAIRTANSLANVPDLVANLGARAVTPLVRDLTPVDPNSQELLNTNPLNIPPLGQDYVPGPSGHEILGGVQSAGEFASAAVKQDFGHFDQDPAQTQRELTQQAKEANPGAFFLGQVSSDVLALTTMRAPVARSRANQELVSNQIIGGARNAENLSYRALARQGAGLQAGETTLASNVSDVLRNMTNSKSWRWLRNRAGRATETGVEAAALSALNGEADPYESFGFAAGMQMAGSGILSASSGLLSGNIKDAGIKLGVAALATGSIYQIAKDLAAGGRDFILDSAESGFEKVALFLATGFLAGSTGMGRVTPMNVRPEKFAARVADAISSLPRAATISLITEGMDDPAVGAVVKKLSTTPDYFGPNFTRRLERAYLNGNFRNELETLMSSDEFRKKFEAIR